MDHLAIFHDLYEAFNRQDADGVLAMMSEEVDWPNAWKGGRLVGRDAVRDYWIAEWAEIDLHVEPLSVTEQADGSFRDERPAASANPRYPGIPTWSRQQRVCNRTG